MPFEQNKPEQTLSPDLIMQISPAAEKKLRDWGIKIEENKFYITNKLPGSKDPIRRPLMYSDYQIMPAVFESDSRIKLVEARVPKGEDGKEENEVLVKCWSSSKTSRRDICEEYRIYLKYPDEAVELDRVGCDPLPLVAFDKSS